MVNKISWGSYWSVLFILVIIYYAYVLWIYYRSDLRIRLTGKNNFLPAGNFHAESRDELLPEVLSLRDEVTAYLEQANLDGAEKTKVIFALQQIIKKYASLKTSPHQKLVNLLLKSECGSKCAVHLSEDEIKQVWMG